MKTIEYLPTGHIFQMPDEDADALLKNSRKVTEYMMLS